MTLFQRGDFTLAHGKRSEWKIECDTLTDEDWVTLAHIAVGKYGFPGAVEGVPRGGIPFAEAIEDLSRFRNGPLWIVDDVLTTGGSLERHRAGREAFGLVVFARGPLPSWVNSLFIVTD